MSEKSLKKINKEVKHRGENGYKYTPKLGLILLCQTEQEQETLFNKLQAQGLKPKVVQI